MIKFALFIVLVSAPLIARADSPQGPVESCNPDKVAQAPAGYACQAGNALWTIDASTYSGKRVYLDLTSKLKVTAPLDESTTLQGARKLCATGGFSLPTGYPSYFKGELGFPNSDSDFTTLEADHFRDVVPGVVSSYHRFLWSTTPAQDSVGIEEAYSLNSLSGEISTDLVFDDSLRVVCISR